MPKFFFNGVRASHIFGCFFWGPEVGLRTGSTAVPSAHAPLFFWHHVNLGGCTLAVCTQIKRKGKGRTATAGEALALAPQKKMVGLSHLVYATRANGSVRNRTRLACQKISGDCRAGGRGCRRRFSDKSQPCQGVKSAKTQWTLTAIILSDAHRTAAHKGTLAFRAAFFAVHTTKNKAQVK